MLIYSVWFVQSAAVRYIQPHHDKKDGSLSAIDGTAHRLTVEITR